MQMTDKLLTEVILLIFMVRDTTLWEWALPFCCRVQALLVYMISILCRPLSKLSRLFDCREVHKQHYTVKQQNSCKDRMIWGWITELVLEHAPLSFAFVPGTDTRFNGLHVGKQGHLTIKYNKIGGNNGCLC